MESSASNLGGLNSSSNVTDYIPIKEESNKSALFTMENSPENRVPALSSSQVKRGRRRDTAGRITNAPLPASSESSPYAKEQIIKKLDNVTECLKRILNVSANASKELVPMGFLKQAQADVKILSDQINQLSTDISSICVGDTKLNSWWNGGLGLTGERFDATSLGLDKLNFIGPKGGLVSADKQYWGPKGEPLLLNIRLEKRIFSYNGDRVTDWDCVANWGRITSWNYKCLDCKQPKYSLCVNDFRNQKRFTYMAQLYHLVLDKRDNLYIQRHGAGEYSHKNHIIWGSEVLSTYEPIDSKEIKFYCIEGVPKFWNKDLAQKDESDSDEFIVTKQGFRFTLTSKKSNGAGGCLSGQVDGDNFEAMRKHLADESSWHDTATSDPEKFVDSMLKRIEPLYAFLAQT